MNLKRWFFYLVAKSLRLLEADLLSPSMFSKIGVLFSIIRVVRMWCGILVSAAGFTNNECKYKSLVAGFQDKAK